ncbi:MAG: hypothetical protein HY548_01180, partial [Elusimicrobia bacterium]|nr:hypothetical protein [Elusimicrobiota bacterium]
LFYFSKATLTKALLKTGFSIAETAYPGYSRSYRSMVYGVFPGKWARAVFTMNGAIDFPVYLNMYDILLCVARKPTLVI